MNLDLELRALADIAVRGYTVEKLKEIILSGHWFSRPPFLSEEVEPIWARIARNTPSKTGFCISTASPYLLNGDLDSDLKRLLAGARLDRLQRLQPPHPGSI